MAKIKDLMNTSVVTASPDTTVTEAAAGMVRAKVGSVIVLQGPFLAGILTERDVLRAAASGEDLSVSLVSAWMSPDPQAASLDMPGRGSRADHAAERLPSPAGARRPRGVRGREHPRPVRGQDPPPVAGYGCRPSRGPKERSTCSASASRSHGPVPMTRTTGSGLL